ncbi:hypothetical protein [Fructobacillus durionis]|uniref:hypothetical protein n=1 Tax=Fructobacillus durionis TaxID=283737 RepID=UPI000B84CA88|nr:hypothetical protein [Fructobacillus durionis]
MVVNFELKNIIGQTVPYSAFDKKEELVEVIGNFYHYRLAEGLVLQPNQNYLVEAADGNQLIIREADTKG